MSLVEFRVTDDLLHTPVPDAIENHTTVPAPPEVVTATTDLYAGIHLPHDITAQERAALQVDVVSDHEIAINGLNIALHGDKLFVFNALLKFYGQPARAENIRDLGFHEGASVPKTRQRLLRTIKTLRNELNDVAQGQLIETYGVTKGTRYQISPKADILDKRPVMLLVGENPSYVQRETVVNNLVNIYKDDDYVLARIAQYSNPDYSGNKYSEDPVGSYLSQVGAYRLLTKEDEVELFGQIETGLRAYAFMQPGEIPSDEVRTALLDLVAARQIAYVTNLRLAVSIAKKFWHSRGRLGEMDLIQEANEGLSRAIPRMSIEKGYKFSTYSTWWIKQSITRALANSSREIRLPVHKHEQYISMRKKVRELEATLMRTPSEAEIESVTEMSYLDYKKLIDYGNQNLVSFNSLLDEDGTELGDLFITPSVESETVELERKDEIVSLFENCPELTPRHKIILGLRMGLDKSYFKGVKATTKTGKTLTYERILAESESSNSDNKLAQVGHVFGISAERVRQLEYEALNLLRASTAAS